MRPAAFGRLCVETPLGERIISGRRPAAFGRLCVETCFFVVFYLVSDNQPPSGGCVLKPARRAQYNIFKIPAAFGRLCVETQLSPVHLAAWFSQPPSGGCVLKLKLPAPFDSRSCQPPSGGCVLKPIQLPLDASLTHPAAFGRLCVETSF